MKSENDNNNLCPPPMTDKEFREKIIDFFLGKDWVVNVSMSQNQVNRIAYDKITENENKILNKMDYLNGRMDKILADMKSMIKLK